MPTFDTLTGTPVWHPTIRTPDGTAPRNATTEAAGMQDVTDCLAFLKSLGPDRIGNVAAMIGTPAVNGDVFWTREFGLYVFAGSITSGIEPFVKPTAVVGLTGSWVSPMWAMFTGSSNPPLISSALIPPPSYPRFNGLDARTCAIFAAGTQHITTSTYVQINDGSNDLTADITCTAGDRVKVSIGPIYGNTVNDADGLTVNAHVIDGVSSADYPMPLVLPAPTGANVAQCKYLEFEHVVGTGPIEVHMQAKCSIGGAGYVHFEAFGPTNSQWIRLEVIR